MCQAAIGLVGDLSRGISDQLIGYCDDIMQIMIDTLSVSTLITHTHTSHFTSFQNPMVHRAVKPPILSTIGDIALAVGSDFKKYANPVLTILEQASRMPLEKVGQVSIDHVTIWPLNRVICIVAVTVRFLYLMPI